MHNLIILLKNQGQGAYHSPEEIDSALNSGAFDKFNEEKRQFENTGYISTNLGKFKKQATVTLTAGFGPLPADYDYVTNASKSTGEKIDIVPESEWVERVNDPIDVPDADYPICAIRDQIEVKPTSLANMKLFYLRQPATMVFNYTTDGDGNNIYNPSGSVDCDFPKSSHDDVLLRGLVYLGTPLSDELLIRLKAYKLQTEKV